MENIENIYSLSPLQQGLLFHSVYEPASRVYQQQLSLRIDGELNRVAFVEAWRHMMARHAVLRTVILWEELDDAYQVVMNDLPLPLTELDWRGRSDRESALRELEIAQREEPLDLAAAPLMRLCLVRLETRSWQFIWTHHHIVLDGWSEGIVLRDWLACYQALSRKRPPALAPVRPFQDYISWLAEQDDDAAEAYWRSRLGSVTEPTPLPNFATAAGDLPHAELPYAEQGLVLSSEESRRLLDFARAQRVTLNTPIQAAWGWLLGTYAGQRQALFGITLGGRPATLAHADGMVGLFINTLPLRVEWQRDIPVGDWLRELQAQVAELRQYEYSALYRLKALSGIPGDRALFEAILVFENFPLDASLSEAALGDASAALRFSAAEGATRMGDVRLTQGRNNFPLSLIAIPSGAAFEFALSYARGRFTDDQIRHMLRHFRALLNELTRDAQAPVDSLHGLPAEEQRQLLVWGTGAELPIPALGLHQLFERHAETQTRQEALVTGSATLTYAELEARANRLTRVLHDQGVQSGQFVAIALERGADFIVSLLAVLKAGAAYLPLDLKQPPARLAELLADSGAPLVLTHSAHRRQLGPCPARRMELDRLQAQLDAASPERLAIDLPSDAAAYLIYTSGSTGTPKGVVVEHRAIVDYLHSVRAVLVPPAAGRYAMLSTVAADLGHTQLFGALCQGGTLVLVDEETSFDPLALADFLTTQPVDVLKITPGHLRGLLDAHPDAALLPRHTLVFGGDALDGALLEQVHALAPELRIFNHYGPAEAIVGAVAGQLPALTGTTGAIPLGKPLPNRRLYVLDARGRPAPIGVPGELYIGGALARGYLNRPQLTQERFVSDTVAGGGTRLYRTGDRVRWLTGGELAFLGRVDNQVKIRGNRVELGEVEAQVKQLSPHIRQAVVRLVQPEGQAPCLAAYIVAGQSLSAAKLRDDLSLRVPDYMVPAHFITLDAIPLTANGKPDYRQLTVPQAQAGTGPAYAPPRNEVERILADIWQEVLKVERIGIHDNFFTLGGDSILNLQIIARAHQQGLRLTPKQLFDNRSIADIAAVLAGSAVTPGEQPQDSGQPIPLSASQRARLDAGPLSASWRCLALDQDVDSAQLTQALAAVRQHRQALRLALEKTSQGEWQQRLPAQSKALSVSERLLPWEDTEALTSLAEECLQKLDPAAGETLHACLLRDKNRDETRAVLLVAHPLCLDDASWPLLLGDLGLALAQLKYQRPLQLAQTGGDFVAWNRHQQDYVDSETLDAAWEHWLQYAGLELPLLDIPDTATTAATLRLDAGASACLQRLREGLHLSWATLLTAVLAEQIHAGRGEANHSPIVLDIECGRPDAARLPADAPIAMADLDPSHIVGPLALATPVFLQWPAVDDPLQRLHHFDGQLHSQPQQGADYGVLRYLSANAYMQESLAILPRAQIALRLLGDWDAHREEHGPLQAVTGASLSPAADYALTVDACWQQGRLRLDCRGPLAESWAPALTQRLQALAALADARRLRPASHAFPLCRAQAASLITQPLDWGNLEDVYPLTPMQQGMLLHTLLQPHSGVYLMQQRYRWDGPLDRSAMEAAWRAQLQRHPMLRTGFWWQDDHAPLQCVYRHTDSAFAWHDYRHLDEAVQQRQLDQVLVQERQQGFDMSRAPLSYLRVFQLGERHYSVVRSFHHILTDAWCFGLLMEDLLAIYQAQVRQEPVARPLLRPFRNYIGWLARQDMGAAQAFWSAEMAGLTEPTPLIVDAPAVSPEQAPEEVDNFDLTLSIAQTQRLQQLCQQYQLTPNTWIQGAWALLLARYSGQRDVLFGVTVAGRPTELAGVEETVGLFINSLPLRVKIHDEQEVTGWLQDLLAHNVELRRHEHAPLVEIQRWSEIPRGRPLFESLVVFENAPVDVDVGGIREREFSIDIDEDRVHTNFPLTVVLYPGDRLGIRLSYDRQRFARDCIERMLGHLVQLLSDMLERPQAPLQSLDMLPDQERRLLLTDWNQTGADFPLDRTYAALFAVCVAAHPERIAAVCGSERLTYAELDRRANRIAQALLQAGAGPDTLVALAAERGLALLTMMIATLKAGAAFLSLDINHPPQRLRELLNLSEAPVVLVSRKAQALLDRILPQTASQPACLVAEALWQTAENPLLPCTGAPDQLAYVIFTSGSTGIPKGTMVEQRGMLNNIFGKVPALGLNAEDRIAQTASPAFDICVWQFLAAPLLGAAVHILPDAVAHDPARLLDAIDSDQLTILEAVPAVIQGLMQECRPHHSLASLRWLIPTGEALPPALCRDWFARFPQIPMMNAYGPAECSDDVAFYPITTAPADDCLHMPIGRPTANNRLFILDDCQRPVPIGVPGEIAVGGRGVGRGYLKDPERTRQAFIPHTFEAGARFYRTGDMGRFRPDGVIEYLGRKDQQVKIRGHRIEPGEIESRLSRHPSVQEAAVIAVADRRGSLQLVAYYALKSGADSAALAAYLGGQLASYMVPAHWVQLDQLPRNANGKIDRRALAALPLAEADIGQPAPVAPRSATERSLADIWKDILGLAEIGVEDNFFALGGHSLLATQVVSRIRRHLGVELPLRTLFERNTIAALAEAVDIAREVGGNVETGVFEIPRVSREQPLPLSYAQQRLWVLDQLEGANAAYNIPLAVKLSGVLNTGAVQAAVNALVQRHESLRTCFRIEGNSPRQFIVDDCDVGIVFHDLSQQNATEQEQTAQRLIDEEAERPFDLSTAPMLRVALLRLAEHTHILQFTLHHIAADAWSLGILVREFSHCYQAFAAGTTPALPPLPIQYADYAHWQRSAQQQERLARDLDYWRRQFQGVPAIIKLPLDSKRPSQPDYRGAALHHTLPAAQVQALKTYGQAHNATLFMVFLNAFNSLLQRATGENDYIVGTDIANREHHALEGLIGFFVNVLPLRARLNDTESFTERLETLRDTTLQAYQHQQVPFDKLVEVLQPPRQPGVNPLVQVLFVMQNTPKADTALKGLDVEEIAPQHETSKFDLAVFLEENEAGEITARWLYRTRLFHPGTVENFKQGFQSLLEQVADNAAPALTQWQWGIKPSKPVKTETASRKKAKLSKLKGAKPTMISHAPPEHIKTSTLAALTHELA